MQEGDHYETEELKAARKHAGTQRMNSAGLKTVLAKEIVYNFSPP